MADAVLERPAAKRSGKPPTRGWWGNGSSPTERWPGVTVELEAVWVGARKRWESPDGRFYYDQAAADRVVEFFPAYLRHYIGHFDGQPFTLMPYQEWLIARPLFGWKSSATGLRRFRKLFGFLPKGAGKSPLGAGLGFYLAFCCGEPGAEVYAVASEMKQARVVHDNARVMAERIKVLDPELGELLLVKRDEIERTDTHSKYIVLSADASSKHGYRPFAVVMDEMHAQKNRDLYEVLWRSMIKRLEPVMLILTHAGHDDEGICFEEYDYAKRVLAGAVTDASELPVIFEGQPDDDPFAEETWRRVNPGHGVTVQHDGIVALAAEAKSDPRKLNDFLMWHLNRWVNQAVSWLPIDWWDQTKDEPIPPDDVLRTLPCAAGLDMAAKIDLACFSVTFRQRLASAVQVEAVDGQEQPKALNLNYRLITVPFFWIPEERMREHEARDGVPYSDWVRQGLVTPTPGMVIDYTRILDDITTKIAPRFPRLRESVIGYDPAFATDLATQLRKWASRDEWCLEVLQNYTHLSEPCYVFEGLAKSGRIVHGANRVLRNHVGNVAIKSDDAKRIRPVKPKQASKHIDGVVASLMGLKMLASVPDTRPEVFAEWV